MFQNLGAVRRGVSRPAAAPSGAQTKGRIAAGLAPRRVFDPGNPYAPFGRARGGTASAIVNFATIGKVID